VSFNISTLRWQQNRLIFMVFENESSIRANDRRTAPWPNERDHVLKAVTDYERMASDTDAKSNRDFLADRNAPQAGNSRAGPAGRNAEICQHLKFFADQVGPLRC